MPHCREPYARTTPQGARLKVQSERSQPASATPERMPHTATALDLTSSPPRSIQSSGESPNPNDDEDLWGDIEKDILTMTAFDDDD